MLKWLDKTSDTPWKHFESISRKKRETYHLLFDVRCGCHNSLEIVRHTCRTNAAKKDEASEMISNSFGNNELQHCSRFQYSDVLDVFFFFTIVFVLLHPLFFSLWLHVDTDTSAGSRWTLERRRRWRTFATWWWPTTRIGLCPTPSPCREPRNCSMRSHCPRCCLSMNSFPSCMTNIPSMYDNSTESTGRNLLTCCISACAPHSFLPLWSWFFWWNDIVVSYQSFSHPVTAMITSFSTPQPPSAARPIKLKLTYNC